MLRANDCHFLGERKSGAPNTCQPRRSAVWRQKHGSLTVRFNSVHVDFGNVQPELMEKDISMMQVNCSKSSFKPYISNISNSTIKSQNHGIIYWWTSLFTHLIGNMYHCTPLASLNQSEVQTHGSLPLPQLLRISHSCKEQTGETGNGGSRASWGKKKGGRYTVQGDHHSVCCIGVIDIKTKGKTWLVTL